MESTDDTSFQSASKGISATNHPVVDPDAVFVAPSIEGDSFVNTLRMGLNSIGSFRIDDIHFEFGSSFLLPFDFDAGPLKRLLDRHSDAKLAVFGHADPVGDVDFNKVLSGRRAATVYGLLIRDVDLWDVLYRNHDLKGKDEWGVQSIQIMLRQIGHDPGRTDGQIDELTRTALQSFQELNGLQMRSFDNEKQVNSQTFKKLAHVYMDAVCIDRSEQRFPQLGPQGQLLKPEMKSFQLHKTDFIAHGDGPNLKADVQGCGEFNPLIRFSTKEEAEFVRKENHATRNRENQPNRRVIIFLFRANVRIDPMKWPCPTFKQGVADCKKRFFSDHERRSANTAERREYRVTKDAFACRFFQRLYTSIDFQILGNERLVSRFALVQFEGVARLFTRNEFHTWLLVLFGADIPADALDKARQELIDHKFPNCPIEVVRGGIDGHLAAYDRIEKLILIDQSLARRAEHDNNAATELLSALIEEFGHFVDDRLRTELSNIGGDADLDEGATFGFAMVNLKHDIQGKTEFATYAHDGVNSVLSINYEKLREATQRFFSEQERVDDARTARFEFFGAGPGGHRSGQQPGSSLGHESIEFGLESVGFTKDNDPRASELKRIYYGNWLRDFSQLVDPAITRAPNSSSITDGFSRASLTKVVDIIAREHFGNDRIFAVTEAKCLVYRPDHHIDNPKGLKDSRSIDPLFRHAFNPLEGEIDSVLGLKKYIRTPGLPSGSGFSTAAEFMVSELDAAMNEGKTTEGFRRLGAALHTLEDYYAHSNFVELSLIELGHTKVFPWAGTPIVSSNALLNGKFPIVTGMFGKSDTLVSVLDVVGEHLQNLKPCEAGARGAGAKIAIILLKDIGQSKYAERLEFVLAEIEKIKKDFPRLATMMCRLSEMILRWLKALIGSFIVKVMDQVEVVQKEFENNPMSNDPTHSMLSKDHDVHPLHVMAANLAQEACKDVAQEMRNHWLQRPGQNPSGVALQYLVHPALLRARFDGKGDPLPGGLKSVWDMMKVFAGSPANQGRIKTVEGRKWLKEQLERARKSQAEIKRRAMEFDKEKTEEEIREMMRRIEELQKPLPPIS